LKAAVVIFPGSNCEHDTVLAIRKAWGIEPETVWHKDRISPSTDLVVLPGGFSYGDYLRAGSIARFSPVMKSVVEFAGAGGAVLGICNGFQILLEARLLPGAMMRNRGLHFVCKWVNLRVERDDLPWTAYAKRILRVPIAHATGNYFIDPEGLQRLKANRQIVFRYCDETGSTADHCNPNGSVEAIAGVCNEAGNVLGMMPHPERAVDADLGSEDGMNFWLGVKQALQGRRAGVARP
jgi:phosphoribosylformylglycinamidine synthase